jgi:hypothetical protein
VNDLNNFQLPAHLPEPSLNLQHRLKYSLQHSKPNHRKPAPRLGQTPVIHDLLEYLFQTKHNSFVTKTVHFRHHTPSQILVQYRHSANTSIYVFYH